MERTEPKSGKIIVREAVFDSGDNEINLEGNDLDELYSRMNANILNNMIKF